MSDSDSTKQALEAEVIKQAYAMTLEPHRLEDFEGFWEQFVDLNFDDEGATNPILQTTEIAAHVARAMEIIERLRVHPGKVEDAQSIVDANFGFAIMVKLSGRIVVKNPEARSAIPDQRQISETDWDRDSVSRIEAWLARLSRSNDPAGMFVHLWLGAESKRTCLFLTPLNLSGVPNAAPADHVLITSVDTEISPEAFCAIQDTFQLTEAEAQVAQQLANGKTPQEIAFLRKATINTVRTQIKQVLTKTDSRGIPDMVRRLCAMSGRFVTVSSQARLLAQRLRTAGEFRSSGMTLSDGRYLEFIEMGHPRGKPVIYCHHLMIGPKLTVTTAQSLAIAGLRVIAPWRPGFGSSDPNPLKGTQAIVASHANDLLQLCQHLGIRGAVVMGGAPQVQYFALAHPDLVTGLLFVNDLPIWDISYLSHYTPRGRRLIKTSLYAPALLPYPPRVAKILFDSGRERTFIEGLIRGNETDREAMNDPDVFDTFAGFLRDALKQGVSSYVRDVEGAHTDFSEQSHLITCPVTVLLGSANSFHPVVGGERFQQLVPHSKLRIIEGAGSFLLYTHPHLIVEELRRLSG